MNKAERDHINAVVELGCAACLMNRGIYSPAQCHHVRHDGAGGNGKRDHFKVIGLCPTHHQFHGAGVSIHDGLESWELIHGSEQELLDYVNLLL